MFEKIVKKVVAKYDYTAIMTYSTKVLLFFKSFPQFGCKV